MNEKLGRPSKAFLRSLSTPPKGFDKTYTMYAKYRGKCYDCGKTVNVNTKMVYNATKKEVRHMSCPKWTKEYTPVSRHQKY